jgi:hypothetical protein
MLSLVCSAQPAIEKGKMEILDFGDFKLHVYNTNDALGNASYIIEGKNGLVTLEHPLFKENIAEFNSYIKSLKKPVVKSIADYHVTGSYADFQTSGVVMAQGMPAFEKGGTYGGMMQNFSKIFGDAIDVRPHGKVEEVPFGSTRNWAGIRFAFSKGAASDFPAASILIGDKVYYMHFTPAANVHMNALQFPNREAIDATLAELKHAKASGATTFIGGHGAATGDRSAVDFQIEYLEKVKKTVSEIRTEDEFILVMQMIYKDMAGEDSLTSLATNLYK